MNKKFHGKGILLAAGLLFTGMCMATTLSRSEVSSRCHFVSEELIRLADQDRAAPCVDQVVLSALYVDRTSQYVQQERMVSALDHLDFARKELMALSSSVQCASLSPQTTFYAFRLSQLKRDIQELDAYPSNPSSTQK